VSGVHIGSEGTGRTRLFVLVALLTVVSMAAFWDIAPCSLMEVYRRFRGAYCLNYQRYEAAHEKAAGNIGIGPRDCYIAYYL
jgi:cobalamin synthase